jgi:tetratricopeptide (TPR) repeat protein
MVLAAVSLSLGFAAAGQDGSIPSPGAAAPQQAETARPATKDEKVLKARGYYAEGEEFLRQQNYVAADDAFQKAQALLQEEAPPEQPGKTDQQQPGEKAAAAAQPPAAPEDAHTKTIREYKNLLARDPRNADICYNIALEHLKAREFEDARVFLKKTIELNPRDKEAYYNLGVLYENYLNDVPQALACYRAYVKYGAGEADSAEVKSWIKELTTYRESNTHE